MNALTPINRMNGAFALPSFDSLFDGFLNGDAPLSSRTVPVDVFENDESYVIEAEVPGRGKDGMDVSIDGRTVTIRSRDEEGKQEGREDGKYIRREISSLSFSRSIVLPRRAAGDQATAEMKNGILRVTVPKAESEKPRTLEIK